MGKCFLNCCPRTKKCPRRLCRKCEISLEILLKGVWFQHEHLAFDVNCPCSRAMKANTCTVDLRCATFLSQGSQHRPIISSSTRGPKTKFYSELSKVNNPKNRLWSLVFLYCCEYIMNYCGLIQVAKLLLVLETFRLAIHVCALTSFIKFKFFHKIIHETLLVLFILLRWSDISRRGLHILGIGKKCP